MPAKRSQLEAKHQHLLHRRRCSLPAARHSCRLSLKALRKAQAWWRTRRAATRQQPESSGAASPSQHLLALRALREPLLLPALLTLWLQGWHRPLTWWSVLLMRVQVAPALTMTCSTQTALQALVLTPTATISAAARAELRSLWQPHGGHPATRLIPVDQASSWSRCRPGSPMRTAQVRVHWHWQVLTATQA